MLGPQGAHISHSHVHVLLHTHAQLSVPPVFTLQAYSGHLCELGMGSSDRHESKLVQILEALDSWGDRCAILRCYGGV